MSIQDSGHRPHGTHFNEKVGPTDIAYGPSAIRVELTSWGPSENVFTSIYDALQANWGDAPSRTGNRECHCDGARDWARIDPTWAHKSGWCRLLPEEQHYVESAFKGSTLQQVLEGISFHFTIDGVTRAFTHQHVRTRMGAAFMQHGGRDNDWRHRAWTMPETIRRACERDEGGTHDVERQDLQHCITDWKPIAELKDITPCFNGYKADRLNEINPSLRSVIEQHLDHGRQLYAALVDAGIPWQDARRVLPIGTQTYIHDTYNYIALRGMLANRMEHIMDWEMNCVAQLMKREVMMKCPPLFGKYLMSHSDKARKAMFAGLDSWPPDGKWPVLPLPCATCNHAHANHHRISLGPANECEVCIEQGQWCKTGYVPPADIRTHRPEQNPYWVLAPESMAGGMIRWIPTNGEFPAEARHTTDGG